MDASTTNNGSASSGTRTTNARRNFPCFRNRPALFGFATNVASMIRFGPIVGCPFSREPTPIHGMLRNRPWPSLPVPFYSSVMDACGGQKFVSSVAGFKCREDVHQKSSIIITVLCTREFLIAIFWRLRSHPLSRTPITVYGSLLSRTLMVLNVRCVCHCVIAHCYKPKLFFMIFLTFDKGILYTVDMHYEAR